MINLGLCSPDDIAQQLMSSQSGREWIWETQSELNQSRADCCFESGWQTIVGLLLCILTRPSHAVLLHRSSRLQDSRRLQQNLYPHALPPKLHLKGLSNQLLHQSRHRRIFHPRLHHSNHLPMHSNQRLMGQDYRRHLHQQRCLLVCLCCDQHLNGRYHTVPAYAGGAQPALAPAREIWISGTVFLGRLVSISSTRCQLSRSLTWDSV